jgi:hypothetical protein
MTVPDHISKTPRRQIFEAWYCKRFHYDPEIFDGGRPGAETEWEIWCAGQDAMVQVTFTPAEQPAGKTADDALREYISGCPRGMTVVGVEPAKPTLRDKFAMAALASIRARPGAAGLCPATAASVAYQVADAMLVERREEK